MTQHTPFKLKRHGIQICTDESFSYIGQCDGIGYEKSAANAERLVHCWNMHDELVKALFDLYQFVMRLPEPNGFEREYWQSIYDNAKAALAKTTGGAA